eukprot:SM000045S16257  [mRNA]  locus=s45:530138:531920:+ [translate_table: standard]
MAAPPRGGLLALQELCKRALIDNLDAIGDVGDTDAALLAAILVHCTADQLAAIEDATAGRDLSPVTNELWRHCYRRRFGADAAQRVAERMQRRGVFFRWRTLHDAKIKEQEESQRQCASRLRELYLEAENYKQSRRIQLCTLRPPGTRKRPAAVGVRAGSACGGQGGGGRLMKKARQEYAQSK